MKRISRIVTPNRRENKKNQTRRPTVIEIEPGEVGGDRRRSEQFEAFCPPRQSPVETATPPIAAVLTPSTEREIYRLVETGAVHFVETDLVLICLNSLTDCRKTAATDDS